MLEVLVHFTEFFFAVLAGLSEFRSFGSSLSLLDEETSVGFRWLGGRGRGLVGRTLLKNADLTYHLVIFDIDVCNILLLVTI